MLTKTKVIMFGAGLIGREVFPKLGSHVQVVAFADNDPEKHNTTISGVPVISPAGIRTTNYDIVLITSTSISDMYEQLLSLGVPKDKIIIADDSEKGRTSEFPWDAVFLLSGVVLALIIAAIFIVRLIA